MNAPRQTKCLPVTGTREPPPPEWEVFPLSPFPFPLGLPL